MAWSLRPKVRDGSPLELASQIFESSATWQSLYSDYDRPLLVDRWVEGRALAFVAYTSARGNRGQLPGMVIGAVDLKGKTVLSHREVTFDRDARVHAVET